MIYLFARVAEDRWELVDQTTHPGPDDAFAGRVLGNEKLAQVPWAMVICLEPGTVELSELMTYWGMAPGSDPLTDRHMRAFLELARGKSPRGGARWVTPPSGTAILAENRLGDVAWPRPAYLPLPGFRRSARPWWKFW